MLRSTIGQLVRWLPSLWEKVRLDSRRRLLLLLICFNALFLAVLLLSVRNHEISRSIRIVEEEIRYRVERLATLQARQTQVVYVTATPVTVAQVTTRSATATPTAAPPLTVESTATSTPTKATQSTPTRTPSPVPKEPTRVASPTPTILQPTPTSMQPTPTVTLTPSSLPTLSPTLTAITSTTPTATSIPPTPTIPPAGVPTTVRLNASQTQLTADGASTSRIQAVVLDQYGSPVLDNTPVTLSTNLGTFWGASTVTVLTSGGVAEAILLAPTTSGTATVHATVAQVSTSIAIAFVPGPAAAIALSASPSRLPVGSTSALSIVVSDRFGNRVGDGTQVSLSATLGVLSATSLSTRNGACTATLRSDVAGNATVTAQSGSSSATAAVLFMPAVRIAKSVDRASAPAGAILAYTVVIANDTSGGDSALLTTLTDRLPAGFAYVPGSMVSPAFIGEPTVTGPDLSWNASPAPYALAPGASIASVFQVVAQAPAGVYSNQAAVQGTNLASAGTGATAPVTLVGPSLASVSPDSGCNDAPINATVSGSSFAPGIRAYLGSWPLATSWVDEGILNIVVPQDLPAGIYDLTVVSPGGSGSTLPGAFRALNCGSTDTTLESGYLGTYGAEPAFSPAQGDDDQVQVLFLEVPQDVSQPLYIRVYDPDCGGALDIQNGWAWDTPFTFTVYGGPGAYTNPDAQAAHPTTGAVSGAVLATAAFGEDPATDGSWYSFGPFSPTDGESLSGKRIFKLTIVGGPEPPFDGGSRADLNIYNVALSTSPSANTAPDGAQILGFSWTFLIPQATYSMPPRLFPYVAVDTSSITQHNWDYDSDPSVPGSAGITIVTPLRTISVPDTDVSRDNEERSSSFATQDGERNTTWATSCWARPSGSVGDNLVTFWATDQDGRALAIFVRSTTSPPP